MPIMMNYELIVWCGVVIDSLGRWLFIMPRYDQVRVVPASDLCKHLRVERTFVCVLCVHACVV